MDDIPDNLQDRWSSMLSYHYSMIRFSYGVIDCIDTVQRAIIEFAQRLGEAMSNVVRSILPDLQSVVEEVSEIESCDSFPRSPQRFPHRNTSRFQCMRANTRGYAPRPARNARSRC